MKKLYTIPSTETIVDIVNVVPDNMGPTLAPHACVAEGALSKETCDVIVDQMTQIAPYKYKGCGAVTRETSAPFPKCFAPIEMFGREANKSFWHFDLNDSPVAWMQTYAPGQGYQLHSDAMLGTSRKLTVVALLSDELDYSGGILRVMPYPEYYAVPKTQGTLVAFPSWIMHDVTEVLEGGRCTINMGFYGPPFR